MAKQPRDTSVDALQVLRYYVQSELDRLLHTIGIHTPADISVLDDESILRLGDALSTHFRLNKSFRTVMSSALEWRIATVDIRNVKIMGMGKNRITDLIFRDDISQDSVRFRDYLLEYFRNHPNDDPEGLGGLRPRNEPIQYPRIIAVQSSSGTYEVIDGAHRFTEMLLAGTESVEAYVGSPIDGQEFTQRTIVGPGTIYTMRQLYGANTSESARNSIVEVTKLFAAASPYVAESIEHSWIDREKDSNIIRAGHDILDSITRGEEHD